MHLNTSLKIQVHESRCHTLAQIYEGMMKVQLYLDFFYFQMDRPLTCINVFFFHIIVIIYQSFHIKIKKFENPTSIEHNFHPLF
jgi:hypothetical protein